MRAAGSVAASIREYVKFAFQRTRSRGSETREAARILGIRGTKMGLRTPEQYKQALRDGRAVYFRGEKVADVTTHPVIGIAVEHAALDYRMAHDPKYRELAVVKEGADEYSRYYHIPQNGDDLLKRSALIAASTREGATLVVLIKEIGTDALLALRIIGERLAAAGKPEYRERINQYYRNCRDNDLAVA